MPSGCSGRCRGRLRRRVNRGEHPEGIKEPLPQGWPIPTNNDERALIFYSSLAHQYQQVLPSRDLTSLTAEHFIYPAVARRQHGEFR